MPEHPPLRSVLSIVGGRHMRLALLAGMSVLALGSLYADVDPPSRVARLNYLSGLVEFQAGSTAIRAGSLTAFSFLNLDDKSVQIQLSQGSLQIRIRRLDDDEMF